MKRLFLIAIATFFVCLVALYFYSPGDFKLRFVRLWGYFTIHNNPLLREFDKDFKAVENWRVTEDKILAGGPPKDGIPSVDECIFAPIGESSFSDEHTIIGVIYKGIAKAYPYGILNWHEVVNDEIAGLPITVTLCPLCDTNPVFVRKVNGEITTFGTSGKLYQSCLIMYDRLTDSLWSQPLGLAIAGEMYNQELERIPAIKTTLGQWKEVYPDSLVLTEETGYRRDYTHYPYGTYVTNKSIFFPADNQEKLTEHPKEIVTYIWDNDPDYTPLNKFSGDSKEFINRDVRKNGEIEFIWKSSKAKAIWDPALSAVRVYSLGEEVPSSTAFAFVYPAFFAE